MSSLVFILISVTGGLEGPIEDLFGYAEQQEAYLRDIGSYEAEIRQVREVFKMHRESGQQATSVSQETLTEKTVIGGGRYVERGIELRNYTTRETVSSGHTFAYLLADDFIAECRRGEPFPTVRVQKIPSGEEMPPDGRRMKNLMNPRDILVHGFGDGNRTLRTLCEDLIKLGAEHDMKIDAVTNENGLLQYSIAKDGNVYEALEIDPQRMGMVSGVRLFNPIDDYRLVLEVRVVLGQLPDGRPFPTVWHHIEYDPSAGHITYGLLRSITRNELLSITTNSVEPSEVTFLAFNVPDDTPAIIKYGNTETLTMGSIQGGVLKEGGQP